MQIFSSLYIALQHEIKITSSSISAVPAGGVVTLTCEVVSNLPTQLSWTGPNGPVTSGDGITVVEMLVDPQTTRSTLAFHPLRVSHAGEYTCFSRLTQVASEKEASMLVNVQSKHNHY